MSAKIATDEIVCAAVDALIAQGIEPTLKLLQKRTGGSYTTVRSAFERWKEQRAREQQMEAPPPEVAQKADQLVRVVWGAASRLADARVQEIRQTADRSIASIRSELEHAQEQIAALERQVAALAEEHEQTRAALEHERVHTRSQNSRMQHLEAEYAKCSSALEVSRAEARQHLVDAATLEGECTALKAQVAGLLPSVHALVRREPDL